MTRNGSEMGGPGSRSGIGGQVNPNQVHQGLEKNRILKCFSFGERDHTPTICPAKPVLLCCTLAKW